MRIPVVSFRCLTGNLIPHTQFPIKVSQRLKEQFEILKSSDLRSFIILGMIEIIIRQICFT